MCRCKEQENAPKHALHLVTAGFELQSAGPPSSRPCSPTYLCKFVIYCIAGEKKKKKLRFASSNHAIIRTYSGIGSLSYVSNIAPSCGEGLGLGAPTGPAPPILLRRISGRSTDSLEFAARRRNGGFGRRRGQDGAALLQVRATKSCQSHSVLSRLWSLCTVGRRMLCDFRP